ncbi:hypothetical protein ABPG74_004554 [Tetrahymena malaccensis]
MGAKIFCCKTKDKKESKYIKKDPVEQEDTQINDFDKYHKDAQIKISQLKEFVKDIQQNQTNVQDSEDLKNQKIMMLFGLTGAGKSTFMNYINKKELTLKNKKVILKDDTDKKFIIGSSLQSQKRKVSGIKLKKVYICDSPGLIDNEGYLKDIINTKNILHVINNSQNFSMLFLISPKNFEQRAITFRQSIKSFSNYYEKINNNFCLMINHVDVDDEKEQIKEIRTCLEQLKNEKTSFSQPEKTLINKIDEMIGRKQYIIFQPLNQNEIDKQIDFIESQNYLKIQIKIADVISKESSTEFKLMIQVCVDYIKSLIKKRSKDIQNIFNDMKILQNFIGQELIDNFLNQVTQYMIKEIENCKNDIKFQANHISDNQIEDLKDINTKLISILESQQYLYKILENENEDEQLSNLILQTIELISDQIQKLTNQIQSSDNCLQIIKIYSKLEQINENYELNKFLNQSNNKEKYLLNAQKIIQEKHAYQYNFIMDRIKENQINSENLNDLKDAIQFIHQFQKHSQSINSLKDLQQFDNILNKYHNFVLQFLKIISQDYDQISPKEYKKLQIFEPKQIISYEFIMKFYESIEYLQQLKNYTDISEDIKQIKNQLKNLLLTILSQINQILCLNNQINITILMQYLIQLIEFDKTVIMEISKNEIYQACQNKIEQLQLQQSNIFKQNYVIIFDQSERIIDNDQCKILDIKTLNQVSEISRSLSFLRKLSQWVDLLKNNFKVQNIKERINDLDINDSLINSKSFEKIYKQNDKSFRNLNKNESRNSQMFGNICQEELEENNSENRQNNYNSIKQQSKKIQNLCQYKEFLQNFKNHLLNKFIQYESIINDDARQQQLYYKKYDFTYLQKLDPLIRQINQSQSQHKDKIEQIIKLEIFQSQELTQIQTIKAQELKVSFDKLKELSDLNGIKLLFGQTSLYNQYQKQFLEQLSNLNEEMCKQQKMQQDVYKILEIFQQFSEQLNKHIPEEWELQMDIQSNKSYQKLMFKIMVDRFQFDQLYTKQQEIQDDDLKKYIDQLFQEQVKKFKKDLSDINQQCGNQSFDTFRKRKRFDVMV